MNHEQSCTHDPLIIQMEETVRVCVSVYTRALVCLCAGVCVGVYACALVCLCAGERGGGG